MVEKEDIPVGIPIRSNNYHKPYNINHPLKKEALGKNKKKLIVILIVAILFFSIFSLYLILKRNTDDEPYNTSNFVRMGVPDAIETPGFSPDGNQIIYLSNKYLPDKGSIWIMNIDGTNKTPIYTNSLIDSSFTSPKISPDGNKILFCSKYLNNQTKLIDASIDVLIKNGSKWDNNSIHKQIYVVHDKKTNGRPIETVFNSNGTKILYQLLGGRSGYGDIWIMDSDGTNRTRLTNNPGGDKFPSFNHDDSKIAFKANDKVNEPYHIWIMNSDGSNKKRLIKGDWYYDSPSFIPDGRIVFESARASPYSSEISPGNIWMMKADGSNQVLIVPSRFNNELGSLYPSISPDGTMIVFEHGLYDDDLYYIIDPTGEWKDSDGDGVWDGIDGAPDDPNAGYIKDDPLDWRPCGGVIFPVGLMMAAVWGRWKKN